MCVSYIICRGRGRIDCSMEKLIKDAEKKALTSKQRKKKSGKCKNDAHDAGDVSSSVYMGIIKNMF